LRKQYRQKTTNEGGFLASIATEEYKLKNNDFDIIKPQTVPASEAQG